MDDASKPLTIHVTTCLFSPCREQGAKVVTLFTNPQKVFYLADDAYRWTALSEIRTLHPELSQVTICMTPLSANWNAHPHRRDALLAAIMNHPARRERLLANQDKVVPLTMKRVLGSASPYVTHKHS
jgi:hypothetical protein